MNDSNVESSPLVSIGVPVFNEEQYLDATLRSLVSQTYDRLEIIISDTVLFFDTFEPTNFFFQKSKICEKPAKIFPKLW